MQQQVQQLSFLFFHQGVFLGGSVVLFIFPTYLFLSQVIFNYKHTRDHLFKERHQ